MKRTDEWDYFIRLIPPVLDLASTTFLDDLIMAGIQEAVAEHDSAPIFDWLMVMLQLQGISNAAAFAYIEKNGTICWQDVEAGMASNPACRRLKSYWHFHECRYEKSTPTCSELHLLPDCPLPDFPLRKGRLNQTAYSLFLFIRDICNGDLVGWIDERLANADPGDGSPHRAATLHDAVLLPLTHIHGTGPKLWSMILADLLLGGDLERERWVTTGARMIAVDGLVHNFLHRTGVLRRFAAEHESGPACYGANGCADLIDGLAGRIDAREYNARFPSHFSRFVQSAIWSFCSDDGFDICNGNRIDDTARCHRYDCPLFEGCDRVPLKNGGVGRIRGAGSGKLDDKI